MKALIIAIAALSMAGISAPVAADPDKDESGHGRKYERRHKGGEYKEEYRDGDCKVERKWERNGKFKEERKCEGPRYRARHHDHGYPPVGSRDGAIVIEPPSVVIQPPAVVIEAPPVRIR